MAGNNICGRWKTSEEETVTKYRSVTLLITPIVASLYGRNSAGIVLVNKS